MARIQGLIPDVQGPDEHIFRVAVLPLVEIKFPEIVEGKRHVQVARTQGLFLEGDRPPIKDLGFTRHSPGLIEAGHVVQGPGDVRVLRAQRSREDLQRPFVKRLRVGVSFEGLIELAEE
jgi:hypothetical protein